MDIQFIEQSHEILHVFGGVDTIAEAARTCYRSESKGEESDERLVRNTLIKKGHFPMLEFAWMMVRIVCDRSIAQEITRHRLFSFAMESQRYVNYDNKGMRFIVPTGILETEGGYRLALSDLIFIRSADEYERLIEKVKLKPEIARYVLPNATATRLIMAGNATEWRHFFQLRCDSHAHPMMRKLACGILADAKQRMPVVFDDLEFGE